MIVEEAGATFHNIRNGKELKSGTKAVIKRRDGTSFREFALFVHDFAMLFDKDGNALNPPEVPGSHDDPGVMGINYRSEPMRERLKREEDPAYIFSSIVHGDPATPVLETYPGDEIMIRLLDGAHEEQHSLNVTGMSWKKEIEVKRLRPLCKGKDQILPLPPCPGKDAVIRKYEIAAIQRKIPYNNHGDHDPDGLLFIPVKEVEKAQKENYCPHPLILRANAGEWIEVTLHNLFDPKKPIPYYDYPRVPLDFRHKPSMRVSINPQLLRYDPVNDSGINVGYNNKEQTVGPGESKKYLWYADQEYGACILQSFGDIRNHRYHGLFGAVMIEPAGAGWYGEDSFRENPYGQQAVITAPGVESFRECVVMIQNGIRMLDRNGELIKTAVGDEGDTVDAEDTGEKGYNYRSERFANRLSKDRRISRLFSSRIHGDPATPIFYSYPCERVIFRTMMPADKPRNVGFCIHDHEWKEVLDGPSSDIRVLQGGISIGNTFNMELKDGAFCPGDYLYRSGSLKWDVESGMWGIFLVMKKGIRYKCKKTCRKVIERIKNK
ncbi:MAG: hypothetical protein MSA72_17550 [Lachnospiraceae bacterium]|nr:hypothetical protein [Lachnospiraceae bacterium]